MRCASRVRGPERLRRFASSGWKAAAVAFVALLVAYYEVGGVLVAADHHRVAAAPPRLHAQDLVLTSLSGARLAAWLFVPEHPQGAVVVLHGIHADRSKMLSRAQLLLGADFAVLLPDLQAHGESTGERISFGFLESRDADACINYLRGRFPDLRVGAVGVSMGGAALVLAGRRAELDAAVLEGVYPTITEAVDNRIALRVGSLSKILTPLLLLQLRPRLGIGREDLSPIDGVRTLGAPVLVLSGTADRDTTLEQTEALYAAAPAPKEIWLVPGAGHVDLLRFDRAGYASHVLPFLDRYLRQGPLPAAPPRVSKGGMRPQERRNSTFSP